MTDEPSADQQDAWQSGSDLAAESQYVVAPRPCEAPGYTIWVIALWIMCVAVGFMQNLATRGVKTTNVAGMVLGCVSSLLFLAAVVLQLSWVYRVHQDARRWGDYHRIHPGLALGLAFVPLLGVLWVTFCMERLAAWYGRPDAPGPDLARRSSITRLLAGLAAVLAIPSFYVFGHGVVRIWPAAIKYKQQHPQAEQAEVQEAIKPLLLSETVQGIAYILLLVGMVLFLIAMYCLTRDLYARLEATCVQAGELQAAASETPEDMGDLWPPGDSAGQ